MERGGSDEDQAGVGCLFAIWGHGNIQSWAAAKAMSRPMAPPQPGSVLRSVAQATTEGYADAWGLCPRIMLPCRKG